MNAFTQIAAALTNELVIKENTIAGVKYGMGVEGGTEFAALDADEVETGVETKMLPVVGERKSDKVRGMIAAGKLLGTEQSEVAKQAATELGMNMALARVYVKNNWDKV